ncbi:Uncharacterised protein [uncultured archaeon]|nr:Uncharacterised protein [uncultured archaeon]
MQGLISLEKVVEREEADDFEDLVYHSNRLFSAAKFAVDIVRINQECLKHPLENKKFYDDNFLGRLKDNMDKKSSYALDKIGPYLCYLTSINSFIYGLLKLKYSKEDQGYIFLE